MDTRGQRSWVSGVDWLRQTFGLGGSGVASTPRLASTESPDTASPETESAETESPETDMPEADALEDELQEPDTAPVDWSAGSDSEPLARQSLPARFAGFIRGVTIEGWLWVAVLGLASVLRIWGMGDKPLHHDESMHAFFSLTFARNPASYVYDPLLHGPFQFHAVGFVFDLILAAQWLFHVGGLAGSPWINDTTARIVPVLFGIGIVALPIGLRRELGRAGALVAGLLLAVSPSFVYFSRFLREDIYFNFFMFAMVVCAVRFARERSTGWLIALAASFVLAYATFEGIFLTMLIFIAYLVGLLLWEFAEILADRLPITLTWRERIFFTRAGLFLAAAAIGSTLAYIGLNTLHSISAYVTAHKQESDTKELQLETNTVNVVLWISITIAVVVICVLLWQMFYEPPDPRMGADEMAAPPRFVDVVARAFAAPGRWAANARAALDPDRQPFLRLLLRVNWVQWFVALVVGWMLFAALFWVIPGPGGQATDWGQGFRLGIGHGIWQGLYYWLQQQEVARGGQPWYYYLLLIPLYEQLVVVFGLAGLVYALIRPNRFRLFLVWWFVGSLALYSWAGEKMPWLSIQLLLPLLLLAAVLFNRVYEIAAQAYTERRLLIEQPRVFWSPRVAASLLAVVGGLALLAPMVHSMWVLSRPDAANGPLEMMVYVQTTDDVNTVMWKIAAADKRLHGGQHQLRIGVGREEEWPMYWYLRDYYLDPHPEYYATFQYPASDPNAAPMDVMLLLPADGQAFMANHPTGYTMKQYKLRSWWDEAYKPLPCVPTAKNPCSASAQWGSGVGVANYLSYGSNPPPNAKFDLGRATNRLWRWLWLREPLGDTGGSFDFVVVVNNDTGIRL
jgi:uncharacterized protein (TIGR03663 family)